MKNIHANVNDNYQAHAIYRDETDRSPHVEAARYLIKKYIPNYWKNDCNDFDFVDMEWTLCGYLEMPTESKAARELKLKWIARVLNLNPLLLHNDPDLPF